MAKKISQLDAATSVELTDLIEISQDTGSGYGSRKVEISDVASSLPYPSDESGLFSHEPTFYHTISHAWSSGSVHGFEITDNGDGTIDVADGDVFLRDISTLEPLGNLKEYHIAVTSGISLTNNETNYIYAYYNSGSPIVTVGTDYSSITGRDQLLLWIITRIGTDLYYFSTGRYSSDFVSKYSKKITSQSWIEYGGSGESVAEVGTRKISVSAGSFYFVNEKIDTDAVNTNILDTFVYVYKDGASSFSRTTGQTTITNTQYNRLADNTLQDLTGGNYGIHWVYWCLNTPPILYVVYGQDDYASLSAAENASVPSSANLPPELHFYSTGVLIAKIIIQKSAANFTEVLSPFTTTFTSSAPTVHNGLSGLQGGDTDEYYHLTSSEYTGTGTGDFVRLTSPSIENVTIGTDATTNVNLLLQGINSQTADLLQLKNNAGTTLGKFDITGNLIIGSGSIGTGAENTLAIKTNVAPSSSPADSFQLYSSDFVAGNAVPTFRTENGTIVKLNQNVSTTASVIFNDIQSSSFYTLAEIATPSNPSAGYHKLYFKSDGVLYKLNSAGTEGAIPSDLTTTDGAKNTLTTNSYLNGPDGVPMNIVPFVLPFDAYLISMSASTDGNETWTAEVHVSESLKTNATLSISSTDTGYSASYTSVASFGAGDKIMLYCNGSNILKPRISLVFGRI